MHSISGLYIYPIKSLGGVSVQSANVTERGLEYDRWWMLVDEHNRFLTQRELATLALFRISLSEDSIQVSHKLNGQSILIPKKPASGERLDVQIWNDVCSAQAVLPQADQWFSEQLHRNCRLVIMPPDTRREVDKNFARRGEITGFADGYPFMMIGSSSLDDLNQRLPEALPMNRFRPSIVFSGGSPYEEDEMEEFRINEILFFTAKPCARCIVTTTNQETAERSKEPLSTLAAYRTWNNKVLFGQNILHQGRGVIQVGDSLEILKRKAPPVFS